MFQGGFEELEIQFVEFGTTESFGEVFTIVEGFNFNLGNVSITEGTLGFLNFTSELLESTVVFSDILALLLLVQFDEPFHHTLIEIFTSQMSVTVGGHNLEDSVVNGQKIHIEGSTTKINGVFEVVSTNGDTHL